MLDFNAPEFVVVAIVALIFIGPKDLPKAMRFVGKWVGKARAVARQFRSGFDNMVREAELAELEKQWAEENSRIMAEHPPAALPAPEAEVHPVDAEPVMVEQPAFVEETPGLSAPASKPKRVRKTAAAAVDAVEAPVAQPAAKPRTPRKKAVPPAEAAE